MIIWKIQYFADPNKCSLSKILQTDQVTHASDVHGRFSGWYYDHNYAIQFQEPGWPIRLQKGSSVLTLILQGCKLGGVD